MANRKKDPKQGKVASKGMTEYILNHPISCGYLLVFSEVEHNAENLNFIMEIDRFKDQYSDHTCWNKDWITIDTELKLIQKAKADAKSESSEDGKDAGDSSNKDENRWPSRIFTRDAMNRDIESIWENYLSDDSPNQICLSTEILRKTRKRIDNLHLYGTEVFGEALLDPIKTINRDILPRFMKSETYRVLNSHLAAADPLPLASTLVVPVPETSLIDNDEAMDALESRVFTLDDMLFDRYLFEEFLAYLKLQYSSENFLCVRMIHIFEYHISTKDTAAANHQAWEIYKYFVAPGSAFEVSCSFRVRKEVMLSLSQSSPTDFEKVKRSAILMMNVNLDAFKATPEYAALKSLLRTKKQQKNAGPSMFSALKGVSIMPTFLKQT